MSIEFAAISARINILVTSRETSFCGNVLYSADIYYLHYIVSAVKPVTAETMPAMIAWHLNTSEPADTEVTPDSGPGGPGPRAPE